MQKKTDEPTSVGGFIGTALAVVIGVCVAAIVIAGTVWAVRAILGFCGG